MGSREVPTLVVGMLPYGRNTINQHTHKQHHKAAAGGCGGNGLPDGDSADRVLRRGLTAKGRCQQDLLITWGTERCLLEQDSSAGKCSGHNTEPKQLGNHHKAIT